MRQALLRLVAVITLSQVCVLYGGGFLLAFQELAGAPGSRCVRACCHLAKAGSPYATSCCSLRCGEDPTEPTPEPTRAKKWLVPAFGVVQAVQPSLSVWDALAYLDSDSASTHAAAHPQLYLKHSVLLV